MESGQTTPAEELTTWATGLQLKRQALTSIRVPALTPGAQKLDHVLNKKSRLLTGHCRLPMPDTRVAIKCPLYLCEDPMKLSEAL